MAKFINIPYRVVNPNGNTGGNSISGLINLDHIVHIESGTSHLILWMDNDQRLRIETTIQGFTNLVTNGVQ